MEKERLARKPLCQPVDPCRLFNLLGICLRPRDWASETDPRAIVDRPFPVAGGDARFRDEYLLREVLRKYPGFNLGIDTEAAAVLSFHEDERLNSLTNDRVLGYNRENPCVALAFSRACRKAVAVLGRFPWESFLKGCRFGPGATTRLTRREASIVDKFQGIPECTRRALPLAHEVMRTIPSWYWSVVDGGRREFRLPNREYDDFLVVPKNCKTGRSISVGPDLNVFLQLGVGRAFRTRMYQNAGINLSDQTINQQRARGGSIGAPYATLDLKSASNSVTKSLVWRFLGDHVEGTFDSTWYRIIETIRTDGCMIGGTPHAYELFSAMGNGFTFELESLIFWCLAWAACDVLGIHPDVTVYGDDLIVPIDSVPLLTDLLAWCGFRLNAEKSHWNDVGPRFRESCGAHFLNGWDVTPFYILDPLDSPETIILAANNLVRWASRGLGFGLDGRVRPVWEFLVSHLSKKARLCMIPFGDQDDGLIVPFDEARPDVVYDRNWRPRQSVGIYHRHFHGFRVRTLVRETRAVTPDPDKGLLPALYVKEVGGFKPPPPLERPVNWWERPAPEPLRVKGSLKVSIHFKKRVVHHWPHPGPWIGDD